MPGSSASSRRAVLIWSMGMSMVSAMAWSRAMRGSESG